MAPLTKQAMALDESALQDRRLMQAPRRSPEPGTEDGDTFEVLLPLIDVYESRHYPIEAPDPVGVIKFRMEQGGLTVKDLVPRIGQTNRVYEMLSHKRELTLPMIRNLHRNLGIPLRSLVG